MDFGPGKDGATDGRFEAGHDDEGEGSGVFDVHAGVLDAKGPERIVHELPVSLAVHEVNLALEV